MSKRIKHPATTELLAEFRRNWAWRLECGGVPGSPQHEKRRKFLARVDAALRAVGIEEA